ncbi:hypothetical protein J2S77_001592 [Alkalibacillus salilacus]|uniref:Uncharacterized protein n=1 Tax=Alkalibacillus salilacus TaxID=284582 RepID=A0ABT9VF72_9BACI|nr:hypothetical protein [Alkalibacillus salilacus]
MHQFDDKFQYYKGDDLIKKINVTASILSLMYCLVAYSFVHSYFSSANSPMTWIVTIIPGGVVVIQVLFSYVIKKDYLRNIVEKDSRK